MTRSLVLLIMAMGMSTAAALGASLPGSAPLTSAFTEKLVMEELRNIVGLGGVNVVVDKPRLPMGNQTTATTDITLDGFRFDQRSGRFSAVLLGTIGLTPRFQLPLEGRIEPLRTVAVLSRPMGRGERITASDLEWIDIVSSRMPKAGLTDPETIIGTEARRRLQPGRVLTDRDVGPPTLVRRGQPVRVVYVDGDLRLTALGTARDDGGLGEPVRIVNTASNVQLHGIATGPAEVTVGGKVDFGTGS